MSAPGAVRGFTLIEVLVALIVVALGMGAALSALSSAADNASRLRERTFAQWIAFNQVSLARLALQMPAEGETEGTVEDFANQRWKWTQTVKQLDTPGIYRIQVRVRHDDGRSGAAAQWLADVSGFRGDALSAASGEMPDWDGASTGGGGGACAQRNARGQCVDTGGSSSSSSSSASSASSGSASSSAQSSSSSSTPPYVGGLPTS